MLFQDIFLLIAAIFHQITPPNLDFTHINLDFAPPNLQKAPPNLDFTVLDYQKAYPKREIPILTIC